MNLVNAWASKRGGTRNTGPTDILLDSHPPRALHQYRGVVRLVARKGAGAAPRCFDIALDGEAQVLSRGRRLTMSGIEEGYTDGGTGGGRDSSAIAGRDVTGPWRGEALYYSFNLPDRT